MHSGVVQKLNPVLLLKVPEGGQEGRNEVCLVQPHHVRILEVLVSRFGALVWPAGNQGGDWVPAGANRGVNRCGLVKEARQ